MKIDTIGRYRMQDRRGLVHAELVFCKVTDDDKIEFVTWEMKYDEPDLKWSGHYFQSFREGLKDFLTRIDVDGGR